ncbi:uncharacterized protein BO96DRAFT_468370 [Aspergillus niger CBS 101883]|uniref:uncharacterized protein n=1 Tax=Aspergillus lacticoffeatus (strain CBS 101883) TaxID=1450533 RepID=UPI000D7F814A|nr:uncharacterized protein BO96DRAFT_468370 [Aspergillus niger CBS 101883]PYH53550.1 hypothetical protein BO96DRAFT_468370 [Aspergillus niger CBS 101883]
MAVEGHSPRPGQGGERDRTYDDKGPWDANGTRRVTTRDHAGKRPHALSFWPSWSLSACAFAQVLADFVQRFGHIYESSRQAPSHGLFEKPGGFLSFIEFQVIGFSHSPSTLCERAKTMEINKENNKNKRRKTKRKECRLYCLGLFNYQKNSTRIIACDGNKDHVRLQTRRLQQSSGRSVFGWAGSDGGCIHCMALGLTPRCIGSVAASRQGRTPDRTIQFQSECLWIPRQYQYYFPNCVCTEDRRVTNTEEKKQKEEKKYCEGEDGKQKWKYPLK